MKKSAGYKINRSSTFKGFNFDNNLALALQEVADVKNSGMFEADIVREALVNWIKKKYGVIAEKFKLI